MSELSIHGHVREYETKQKLQRVLDTRYVNSREQFLSDPRFAGIEPFLSKVWLSSPTMHGDEERFVVGLPFTLETASPVGLLKSDLPKKYAAFLHVVI